MKQTLRIAAFTFALLALAALGAGAQSQVQNVPISVQMQVFNAVNTAQCANVTQNIGQNVHLLTYSVTLDAVLRVRLEASNDGTNFFPISADGTNTGTPMPGAVYGFGFFPVLRACLISFESGGTFSAFYSGTSSTQRPEGQFNPAQDYFRALQTNALASATAAAAVYPPFGNSAGILSFESDGVLPAGTCNVTVLAPHGPSETAAVVLNTNLPVGAGQTQLTVPAAPATALLITFTNCGATATRYYLNYFFTQPTVPTAMIGRSASGQSVFVTESEFKCTQSLAFTLAGASNTEIVPLAAGQTIRVCHISFSLTAADDVTIVQGTGVACAGTPANMSGQYRNVTLLTLDFGPGAAIRTSAGFALCIGVAGAATGGGIVSFARF